MLLMLSVSTFFGDAEAKEEEEESSELAKR